MIIMHNEAKEHFSITYSEWFNDYLKSGKFKNFTVTHPKDVMELHTIDQNTGEMGFCMLMDKKIAEQTKRKEPRRFHLKPLEYKEYDKNLVLNEENIKLHPNSPIKKLLNQTLGKSNTFTFYHKIKQRFQFVPKQERLPYTRYEVYSLWLMILGIIATIILHFI
jgi:hypothetical protein